MHISEIEIAIADGYPRSDLERAFQALVGYPHVEQILVGDADALIRALRDLCDVLLKDLSSMPDAAVNAINSVSKDPIYLEYGSSYSEGAARVRSNLKHFEDRFKTFATPKQRGIS